MKNAFEGRYYKYSTGEQSIAFIPAFHLDEKGIASASLQIVTRGEAFSITYPMEVCKKERKSGRMIIGNNIFSENGARIYVKSEDVFARGWVYHGPTTPIKGNIMGPFEHFPGMGCYHSVYSMFHAVNGHVVVNGKFYNFTNGFGYLEGDRGASFPKSYFWTQVCGFCEKPYSIMASVADIGAAGIKFTGAIAAVLCHGKTYRLATYLGAKVESISRDKIVIRQKNMVLEITPKNINSVKLLSPILGKMIGNVHEGMGSTAGYKFIIDGKVLLDFVSDDCCIEWEYENGNKIGQRDRA